MERLQRVLAARGIASRRAAEDLIREGRVMVDGQVVTELGTKVDPVLAEIRVDRKLLRPQPLRYVMINKPSGYITTMSDERGRWTVMQLMHLTERVYPVGRLDRDTEGLLLLTNDGDVAHRIMHPRFGLEKEYHVLTPVRPTPHQLERLRKGVKLDDRVVVPSEARILRETRAGIHLTISVHEGLYHLVRRIMEEVGIEVARLRRWRVGPISVQGLEVGQWRDLTPGEVRELYAALHLDEEALAKREEMPVSRPAMTAQAPLAPLWTSPEGAQRDPRPADESPRTRKTPPRPRRDVPAAATTDAPGERPARPYRPPRPAPAPGKGETGHDGQGRGRPPRDADGRRGPARPPVRGGDRRPRRGGQDDRRSGPGRTPRRDLP